MRPIPRLHAFTDAAALADPALGSKAGAIAAAGSAVALHARDRAASGARLTDVARRFVALARPPGAAVLVNGRPDIARAVGAQGIQLGAGDLPPAAARSVLGTGWIGVSVHSVEEARSAADAGADFLVAGSIYDSASHPEHPGRGLAFLEQVMPLGLPVIAIGGITAARAREVRNAGAYGVAAITALWRAGDPAAAALALLAPWMADE